MDTSKNLLESLGYFVAECNSDVIVYANGHSDASILVIFRLRDKVIRCVYKGTCEGADMSSKLLSAIKHQAEALGW